MQEGHWEAEERSQVRPPGEEGADPQLVNVKHQVRPRQPQYQSLFWARGVLQGRRTLSTVVVRARCLLPVCDKALLPLSRCPSQGLRAPDLKGTELANTSLSVEAFICIVLSPDYLGTLTRVLF